MCGRSWPRVICWPRLKPGTFDQKLVVHQESSCRSLVRAAGDEDFVEKAHRAYFEFQGRRGGQSKQHFCSMEAVHGVLQWAHHRTDCFLGLFVALACLFHLPHLKCTLRPRAGFEELHDSPVLLLINLKPRCFWQV